MTAENLAGNMAEGKVRFEIEDGVGLASMDDGKVNALSLEVLKALLEALERAEEEAQVFLLTGRPGVLSGGFDLGVLRGGQGTTPAGGDAARELVKAGGELALGLYGARIPVVIAAPGHAIAMGALLLCSADTRIGAEGSFKIGLNEIAIGLPLPAFGIELARERISKRHLTRSVLGAEMYTPALAVDAGYLDRVVAPEALLDEARAEAHKLAALDGRAHHVTKFAMRGAAIDRIRASLELG
ncbi:MAG: crotonase/enoyl-CoA hydratase family protein [Deltaproteobacteria bacterium]|nr:crotonase/enoyl-CoA hydratase family protein [Deltaproteobacteria bacterium]MBW2421103.1 crotonase/enoyl-CoA hydratase family protein [Deltaproteobacteria bacterium]